MLTWQVPLGGSPWSSRQFVFSTFFSFSANTFGYASFGRIAGVASTVAGLLQLTQTSLVQYVETQEDATPKVSASVLLSVLPEVLL